jgi:hypothetical protein
MQIVGVENCISASKEQMIECKLFLAVFFAKIISGLKTLRLFYLGK